jgi:cellulose synthase/poly-beta-1,6-N-acetylglucosamine synthase-like glycosyltransferase
VSSVFLKGDYIYSLRVRCFFYCITVYFTSYLLLPLLYIIYYLLSAVYVLPYFASSLLSTAQLCCCTVGSRVFRLVGCVFNLLMAPPISCISLDSVFFFLLSSVSMAVAVCGTAAVLALLKVLLLSFYAVSREIVAPHVLNGAYYGSRSVDVFCSGLFI